MNCAAIPCRCPAALCVSLCKIRVPELGSDTSPSRQMTSPQSPPLSSRRSADRTPFESRSAGAGGDTALEQRTMRKISLRLLPLLFSLYIASQLDRTNVGIAALQMNSAIGLDAVAYSLG